MGLPPDPARDSLGTVPGADVRIVGLRRSSCCTGDMRSRGPWHRHAAPRPLPRRAVDPARDSLAGILGGDGGNGVKAKLQQALRRRELAGTNRTGRYARGLLWDQQISYAKRAWRYLTVIVLVCSAVSIPMAWVLPAPWRWLAVGASITTGFWLVVLTVLLESGSASAYMGVSREETTALHLQDLRRRGWRIVNGLVIRERKDIDHVAIGPAGVLVIESKWSAGAWPIGVDGQGYMRDALDGAVAQVRKNAKDVGNQFRKVLAGAPIRAVVVAWSGSPMAEGAPDWAEQDGVVIVHGRRLAKWLAAQDDEVLEREAIDRIWAAVAKQAETRDLRGKPPRPTLAQIQSRVLTQAPLGACAAGAFFVVGVRLLPTWAALAVDAVSVVAGLRVPRTSVLRWVARGWSWTLVAALGFVITYMAVGLLQSV